MANTYHVRVVPNLEKNRVITRTMSAKDEKEAAGLVLNALGGDFVDCIEVKQDVPGGKAPAKVVFHACLYGVLQGFLYMDRFDLPA